MVKLVVGLLVSIHKKTGCHKKGVEGKLRFSTASVSLFLLLIRSFSQCWGSLLSGFVSERALSRLLFLLLMSLLCF